MAFISRLISFRPVLNVLTITKRLTFACSAAVITFIAPSKSTMIVLSNPLPPAPALKTTESTSFMAAEKSSIELLIMSNKTVSIFRFSKKESCASLRITAISAIEGCSLI